jgi:6,7-dimethyl-8-ribityllumazine synthase
MQIIEAQLAAPAGRFLIVAARFNELVVERLIAGAEQALVRLGVTTDQIVLVRVPGACELPLACALAIRKFQPAAAMALGCVVRGDTYHFEVVANTSATGLAALARETGVPVLNAVLTTDTMEQALDRAGGKSGNKGADVAFAAVEMANLVTGLRT